MRKLLVWPPLGIDDYGGTYSAASYFSWFFGDIADHIIIPCTNISTQLSSTAFSLGSINNLAKIDIRHTWEANIMEGITHILMRSKHPSPLPGNAHCSKMVGSEKVNIAEDSHTNHLYYYIGSPDTEAQDAYHCVLFTYWISGGRNDNFILQSKELIQKTKSSLKIDQSVSVFGTGPSIAEVNAMNHHFDSSIICNTIVKSKGFCRSLNISAIIASDCHFHFSCSQYSFQFLSDLRYQIQNSDAIYITFDKFAPFVLSKVPELKGRTCGIPTGRKEFGFNFDDDFSIFPGESVVNMFMLPVACYFSNNIRLCGFTGRAPNDSYFWGHAHDFQYENLLPTVREIHPGFFKNRDYNAYSNKVGEQLTSRAALARKQGIEIRSLTTSFYKGLEYQGGLA